MKVLFVNLIMAAVSMGDQVLLNGNNPGTDPSNLELQKTERSDWNTDFHNLGNNYQVPVLNDVNYLYPPPAVYPQVWYSDFDGEPELDLWAIKSAIGRVILGAVGKVGGSVIASKGNFIQSAGNAVAAKGAAMRKVGKALKSLGKPPYPGYPVYYRSLESHTESR